MVGQKTTPTMLPLANHLATPRTPASVYVLDIHHLGSVAFSNFGFKNHTTTLLTTLQDALIPKVFFDVRNDSNALLGHYGVKLPGVHDMQCMEAAMGMKGKIVGLGKCLMYLHILDNKRRAHEEFLESALNDAEFDVSNRPRICFWSLPH